jgi:macrolide transport system ATP-binding/permease protein
VKPGRVRPESGSETETERRAADLIRIEDLYKTYHLGEIDVPVLKGVSLSIARGEIVALMGVSGSGKTTLMNILGCLDRPSSGAYYFDGEDVSQLSSAERALIRNRKIGFVFQNFNLLARTNALENVMMPMAYSGAYTSERRGRERARGLLASVGLADRMEHEPSQLSGGQQQRVATARSLANAPIFLLADEPTGNLDSRTSQEILQMLQRLNAEEGITILLVTHDAWVASHAQRIIHIRDGLIVDGGFDGGEGTPAAAPTPTAAPRRDGPPVPVPPPAPAARWPSLFGWLRLYYRTLGIATRALRRNVLRSILTTLGIVIGIAAVITMMEIGQGSSSAIRQTITSMGANTLLVAPGATPRAAISQGVGSANTLTADDAEAIRRECPAVVSVAPVVRARTQVVYGNRNWYPQYIFGTSPEFLVVRDWGELEQGEPFTERDVRTGARVCLLGQTLARELFDEASPIGKEVRVRNVSFKVIGVLSSKGANMIGVDQDDILLAPWTTIRYRVSGSKTTEVNQNASDRDEGDHSSRLYPGSQSGLYPEAPSGSGTTHGTRALGLNQILVKAESTAQIPVAINQITELMHERHKLGDDRPDDFRIRDMTEVAKALSTTVSLLGGMLLCVALISLVVGGVGVMNIMLVSVTERTREIGLRMAVGARDRDILRQFLVEAVVLCLIGGVLGIAVGRGSSILFRELMDWPTEISIPAIISAVAVSASVGLIFGYYPAWKASRLDPIEALRYE